MQLMLISFQRLGYWKGVEDFAAKLQHPLGLDPWHHSLIELTIGQRSLPEVLESASDATRHCQAHYYAGARFLTEGCKAEAEREFHAALSCGGECFETDLCRRAIQDAHGE